MQCFLFSFYLFPMWTLKICSLNLPLPLLPGFCAQSKKSALEKCTAYQCYSSTFSVSCSIFSFSAAMVVPLSQAFCRDQLLYLRRMLVQITFSSSPRSCFCSSANACNSHKSFSLKNVMCHLKTMQILFLDLTS